MPQRFMKCGACGNGQWHETRKRGERPSGAKCACGHAYDADLPAKVRAFAIGNKPWGAEGRSLMYAFDPSAIKEIGATCPSLARAINPTDGTVEFENDSHQKAVYGEMASEKARIKESREREVAANEDALLGDGGGLSRPGAAVEEAVCQAAVSAE